MRTGLDLVHLPGFKGRLKNVDLNELFSEAELKDASLEHLAGLFAAKEAFFKALGRKEDWREVLIELSESGKPILRSQLLSGQSVELSITHDGDYAAAVVIIS